MTFVHWIWGACEMFTIGCSLDEIWMIMILSKQCCSFVSVEFHDNIYQDVTKFLFLKGVIAL